MKYKYDEIGKRIQAERENLGLSQDELLEKLRERNVQMGRNTLSKIENGNAIKTGIDFLIALCKIFNCDMGFLLCEYDERYRVTSELCAETGLSESSIESILKITSVPGDIQYKRFFEVLINSHCVYELCYCLDRLNNTATDALSRFKTIAKTDIKSQDITEEKLLEFISEIRQHRDNVKFRVYELQAQSKALADEVVDIHGVESAFIPLEKKLLTEYMHKKALRERAEEQQKTAPDADTSETII